VSARGPSNQLRVSTRTSRYRVVIKRILPRWYQRGDSPFYSRSSVAPSVPAHGRIRRRSSALLSTALTCGQTPVRACSSSLTTSRTYTGAPAPVSAVASGTGSAPLTRTEAHQRVLGSSAPVAAETAAAFTLNPMGRKDWIRHSSSTRRCSFEKRRNLRQRGTSVVARIPAPRFQISFVLSQTLSFLRRHPILKRGRSGPPRSEFSILLVAFRSKPISCSRHLTTTRTKSSTSSLAV
jgi:hypothetical protein